MIEAVDQPNRWPGGPADTDILAGLAAVLSSDLPPAHRWERCCDVLRTAFGAHNAIVAGRDTTDGARILAALGGAGAGMGRTDAGYAVRVAVRFGNDVVGAIAVERTREFEAHERQVLELAAIYVAARMHDDASIEEITRLERLAFSDGLTRIANRRRFDEAFPAEWSRAARSAMPLTLMMLDVDYFKVFNDTYGHQAGDECLVRVAAALASVISRPGDLVARYGGEEFVVLLPGTDASGAVALAEKIRQAVAAESIEHRGSSLGQVSVSIGIATAVPEPRERPEQLLHAADDSLYKAKLAGRNRAVSESYETPGAEAAERRELKRHNLHQPASPLVGREAECARVREALEQHRLVSLVAFGGTGKTRLAIEAALELVPQFDDGVWFVDLEPVRDERLVIPTIARAFGVQVPLEDGGGALRAALRSKRSLIVIDNCEHLLAATAAACDEILRECDGIRILATSREPLRTAGEFVIHINPLPPEASVELFLQLAHTARPDIHVGTKERALVATICAHLEGLPLAIELVAPRLRVFTLEEIAERLRDHFRLLSNARSAPSEKQRTMRASIGWSFELLTPQEQALFRRLSVFSGGFMIDAATAVAAFDDIDAWDVSDLLYSLVEKSFVIADSVEGAERFRMFDLLREYGAEQAQSAGETQTLRARHAAFYLSLAERADGGYWTAPAASPFEDPSIEIANFRAAVGWSLFEEHDTRLGALLAAILARFWFLAASEGRSWVERARSVVPADAPDAIRARLGLAVMQTEAFSATEALDAGLRALDYYRTIDDRPRIAETLYHLAMSTSLYFPEDKERARRYAQEAERLARELQAPRLLIFALRAKAQALDTAMIAERRQALLDALRLSHDVRVPSRLVGTLLMSLSELAFEAGAYEEASRYGRQTVRAADDAGSNRLRAFARANAAHYAAMEGSIEAGKAFARDGLRMSIEGADQYGITCGLNALAALYALAGESREAALLFGFCNARFGVLHPPRQEASCEEAVFDSSREKLVAALGADGYETLVAEGAALGEEQAIALALRHPSG
jgi:diguanylate cyclase (GGDEF)-like protein